MRIVFLLVAVPLIELFLLIKLSELTGWLFTIGLTLITGVLGASLARSQGFSTIRRIQTEMSEGRIPATAIIDAVMILIAGLLLMTPGILTDIFGFSLLVPFIRRVYQIWATKWIRKNVHVETFATHHVETDSNQTEIVDSYVVHRELDVDSQERTQ